MNSSSLYISRLFMYTWIALGFSPYSYLRSAPTALIHITLWFIIESVASNSSLSSQFLTHTFLPF